MKGNVSSEAQQTLAPGIMTSQDYTIALIPRSVLGLVTAFMGIVTNSICIHVFPKMKGKDTILTSFLGLASSDLLFSIFSFCSNTFSALLVFEKLYGPQTRVDSYLVLLFFANFSVCVNEVTILITLYVAISRCLCVAMPLRFKYSNMFTPAQTRCFITAAWLFSVGVYIPILANMGVQEVYSPDLNTTRYVVWLSADRERIKDGVFLLIQTIIPFSTQVILILCIAVMVNKLIQATKFRHEGQPASPNSNGDSKGQKTEPGTTSVKLSGKELKAVKQVVLISVIFVVCNIPMILVAVSSMVVPGFDSPGGSKVSRYGRLSSTFHGYKRVFEQINSSVNLFVYYKFNTKFKECCQTFLCKREVRDW